MICVFCQQPVPLNHFARFSFPISERKYIAHWKCLEDANINHVLDTVKSQSVSKQRGSVHFYLTLALVIIVGVWSCSAMGQITIGKSAGVQSPICKTAKDAQLVADADAKGGPAAAVEALMANPNCTVLRFYATFKKSVYSVKTERGKTTVVEVEVEMADGTKGTFYVLTDQPVQGELTV